jgi:hypothetical protein
MIPPTGIVLKEYEVFDIGLLSQAQGVHRGRMPPTHPPSADIPPACIGHP